MGVPEGPFAHRRAAVPAIPANKVDQCRASNTRLNGVSVARRNWVKPPPVTVLRNSSSEATAPSAGPFKAIEFDVQQSVEAPEKVRPIILKLSSTLFPAIGSTIKALPSVASASAARLQAPVGSPM